jgi:prepilin-type N-terminal cleavage/methylation domain-containing protein
MNALRRTAITVPPPSTSKGFTLIEFIIVIIIIVVLAGLFLVRIPLYQERAEKAAMQQVEGALCKEWQP